ncbi:MAG: ATPase, T2SS/T4P/T4SS family [Candidatus Omnitrophica bacterium]|nr:ATPase, T2SS/T4P/T4SS family [Candidatus Omnitrophota bacterium]
MTFLLTKKICDLLITRKLITEENLNKARETCKDRGGSLSDILVKMGAVSKEDLITVLSEELGFAPINLSRYKIDDELLKTIPKKISFSYQMLPVSRIEKQLTVAMVDPLNIFALDDLKIATNLDIVPVIADEDDMKDALRRYYEKSADEEISEIVGSIESGEMKTVAEAEDILSSNELLRITEEAPVVKLVNTIMNRAVKEHASDVMIEPMENNTRVRFRIDGFLVVKYEPPKKFHQAIVSRIKVMSELDIAERRLPQDGRFRMRVEDRKVDFRISTVPSSYGEKVALRILDKEQAKIDIKGLGFKQRDIEKMCKASEQPHGMILVCGPTGCGKTTTLYSVLKYVDEPGINIVTVEDPVEYELLGINQVAINHEVGLTFSSCLRSILRQDPDVIMVGEIRDYETLDIAIKSALTGHLVLSTLHTNSASGSIVRMINMGVEPFLISASVELIAAQRLLRKLCNECKEPYVPSKEVAEKYKIFDKNGDIPKIYRPKGCPRCMNSGYKGRVGIIECMQLTSAIKDLIFKRAQEFEIERAARKEGMTTLRENGIENVIEGITSLEDVLRITAEDRKLEQG